MEYDTDGWFGHVQSLSELVHDTEAAYSAALDDVQEADPCRPHVVVDDSSGYRKFRLWLAAMLRKTAISLADP